MGQPSSYLKRPAATVGALRQLPTRLVLSQARMQGNLMLLVSLDLEESRGMLHCGPAIPTVSPRFV